MNIIEKISTCTHPTETLQYVSTEWDENGVPEKQTWHCPNCLAYIRVGIGVAPGKP